MLDTLISIRRYMVRTLRQARVDAEWLPSMDNLRTTFEALRSDLEAIT